MNAVAPTKTNPLAYVLVAAALALLVAIYFVPVWWVSLTAPNYPPEAFPDGVRIHFHMNGVFNGCQKVEKAEITETRPWTVFTRWTPSTTMWACTPSPPAG